MSPRPCSKAQPRPGQSAADRGARATVDLAATHASCLVTELTRFRADASDLASVSALADALGRDIKITRVSDLALAFDRARLRMRARALASDITRFSVSASTLDRAADLTLDLDVARDRGRVRADKFERGEAKRVAPSAASLLTTAVRLLPAAQRSRYAEEYRSELWDIARIGDGRIKQLRYALRQLRNALPMSFALRSPRRRSSAP